MKSWNKRFFSIFLFSIVFISPGFGEEMAHFFKYKFPEQKSMSFFLIKNQTEIGSQGRILHISSEISKTSLDFLSCSPNGEIKMLVRDNVQNIIRADNPVPGMKLKEIQMSMTSEGRNTTVPNSPVEAFLFFPKFPDKPIKPGEKWPNQYVFNDKLKSWAELSFENIYQEMGLAKIAQKNFIAELGNPNKKRIIGQIEFYVNLSDGFPEFIKAFFHEVEESYNPNFSNEWLVFREK